MAANPKLRAVGRAAKRRVSIEEAFRQSILEAHESGESLRAIAKAAGMSHVAVLKIIRKSSRV